MTVPAPHSDSSYRHPWKHWAGLAGFTLLLALAMMRAPVVVEVAPDVSYHSLLYETLRLGHTWGEALITTDGPLAAVESPAYSSGSIWMALSWQIGGNLLLAAIVVGSAWRLPCSRRWWALGLFAAVLARLPSLAPWIAMILLGWSLVSPRELSRGAVLVFSSLLGLLALFSIGHFLLGATALGLTLVTPRTSGTKPAATAGFISTLVVTWMALGQPLRGLWAWLHTGYPILWETSSLSPQTDAGLSAGPWFVACATGLAVALIFFLRQTGWRQGSARALFLFLAGMLAWKAIALQPFGRPEVFFATIVAAACFLWHEGKGLIMPAALAAIALGGLVRLQPLMLTDGVGHLNRELVINVKLLAGLSELRNTLREQVKQARIEHDLPRIKAVVGLASVDFIGGQPGEALLASLNLHPRPAPLSALLRSATIAGLNQQAMSSPAAPAFILQRLQPSHDIVPTLEDGTVQLELYRRYEFVLEENGVMLWQRRETAAEIPPPVLVQSGELAFGDRLTLPARPADAGFWLELEVRPNLPGRLRSWVDEIPQPGLLLRDEQGHELHYALPAAVASGGFLVAPFVRGEPDVLRLQTGTALPPISTLSVLAPTGGFQYWNKTIGYRLYAVPDLKLVGHALASDALLRYRLFNRIPIALAYLYPVNVLPYSPEVSIAFAHPDSLVEFATTKQDHRVRASFGILERAYQGNNHTDGVDFSAEFITPDGTRQILYHRLLNPLVTPEDRGLQQLDIVLPAGTPGRLQMRTYNPADRNRAYDWSYWGGITIE